MKTGIQILLTGVFMVFSLISFGQVQKVSGPQFQKKTLIVKGGENQSAQNNVKRKKTSPMLDRKQVVDKRQFKTVPATEK
jgi:hypothetical protein